MLIYQFRTSLVKLVSFCCSLLIRELKALPQSMPPVFIVNQIKLQTPQAAPSTNFLKALSRLFLFPYNSPATSIQCFSLTSLVTQKNREFWYCCFHACLPLWSQSYNLQVWYMHLTMNHIMLVLKCFALELVYNLTFFAVYKAKQDLLPESWGDIRKSIYRIPVYIPSPSTIKPQCGRTYW